MVDSKFKPLSLDDKIQARGGGVSFTQLWAEDPTKPETFYMSLAFNTSIKLGDLFRDCPTKQLYMILDQISSILANRTDARR